MISGLLAAAAGKIGGALAAAGAALAALVAIYLRGRMAGRAQERARQDADTVDLIKDKGNADETAARMSHADRVGWLRQKFRR